MTRPFAALHLLFLVVIIVVLVVYSFVASIGSRDLLAQGEHYADHIHCC